MKATLKGKILKMDRVNGNVELSIESSGKVATTNIAAQEITLKGHILMKGLIADHLKMGSILTITVSDEESDERST